MAAIFQHFLPTQNTLRDETGPEAITPMSSRLSRESELTSMASMKDLMSNMAFIVLRILYTSITNAAFRVSARENGSGSAGLIRWGGGQRTSCYLDPTDLRVSFSPSMNF